MDKTLYVLFIFALYRSSSALTDAELKKFRDFGSITISESGGNYEFASDGIPHHAYGGAGDYGRNPNTVKARNHKFQITKTTSILDEEDCLSMGPVGVAINGVPFYNPYTIEGENAVEGEYAEVFDDCDGHPQDAGEYHYHQEPYNPADPTKCVSSRAKDELLGVAFDGFPIYGPIDVDGNELTSIDLDRCHGRFVNDNYRYHATKDFPYLLGCYKGSKASSQGPGQCSYAVADDYVGKGDDGSGSVIKASVIIPIMTFVLCSVVFY